MFIVFGLLCFGFVLSGCALVEILSGKSPAGLDNFTTPSHQSSSALSSFEIIDPYAVTGTWAKVQLHIHTDQSDGTWSVDEALKHYAASGYDFVAITDHDKVVSANARDRLIVIPAEENTLGDPFVPLGKHAVFLFVTQHVGGATGTRDVTSRFASVTSAGGIVAIAHPSYRGATGDAAWQAWQLMLSDDFILMEVFNPHSSPDTDTAIWQRTLRLRGPTTPVWAVAVDDAHGPDLLNSGWTMVKVGARSTAALREGLTRGSLYATTGVEADFAVRDGAIETRLTEPAQIEYIDSQGKVVAHSADVKSASYRPNGTERFVRVEVKSPSGRRAWSQPFWIVSSP